MEREQIAILFGQFLDNDQFEEMKELLSPDCSYDLGSKVLCSAAEIATMYQDNMLDGRKKFDVLIWGKSFVESQSPLIYDVNFSDYLKHKGVEHNYSCIQRLHFNEQNLIEKIEHIELPGQKEALEQFKRKVL